MNKEIYYKDTYTCIWYEQNHEKLISDWKLSGFRYRSIVCAWYDFVKLIKISLGGKCDLVNGSSSLFEQAANMNIRTCFQSSVQKNKSILFDLITTTIL